jgi:hypothetical protein
VINTWGELWTVVKQWWVTPLKWGTYKVKEEVKQETKSVFDLLDKDVIEKQRQRYNQEMLTQPQARRRYDEWAYKVREHIPFCQKCKDVGCEECQQWPMNQ